MASLTWSVGPASSRPIRVLWYASVSLWFAVVALALGAVVLVGGAALLAGEPGPALLVGLLALVGGPLSLLYLWPMLTDPEQRPDFLTPDPWVQYRWVAIGALAVVPIVLLVPRAAVGAFVGALGGALLVALFQSEGELDAHANRLTIHGRDVDLADVVGVRRLDLGRVSCCWLQYRRRAGLAMAPRWVVCPPRVAEAVVAAVETSDFPRDRDGESRRPTNRLVKALLVVLGLGTFAAGGVLVAVAGPLPLRNALAAMAIVGVMGGVFFWLAYAEG